MPEEVVGQQNQQFQGSWNDVSSADLPMSFLDSVSLVAGSFGVSPN